MSSKEKCVRDIEEAFTQSSDFNDIFCSHCSIPISSCVALDGLVDEQCLRRKRWLKLKESIEILVEEFWEEGDIDGFC